MLGTITSDVTGTAPRRPAEGDRLGSGTVNEREITQVTPPSQARGAVPARTVPESDGVPVTTGGGVLARRAFRDRSGARDHRAWVRTATSLDRRDRRRRAVHRGDRVTAAGLGTAALVVSATPAWPAAVALVGVAGWRARAARRTPRAADLGAPPAVLPDAPRRSTAAPRLHRVAVLRARIRTDLPLLPAGTRDVAASIRAAQHDIETATVVLAKRVLAEESLGARPPAAAPTAAGTRQVRRWILTAVPGRNRTPSAPDLRLAALLADLDTLLEEYRSLADDLSRLVHETSRRRTDDARSSTAAAVAQVQSLRGGTVTGLPEL